MLNDSDNMIGSGVSKVAAFTQTSVASYFNLMAVTWGVCKKVALAHAIGKHDELILIRTSWFC